MTTKAIILVTGANSGIGYDTSYALAAASPDNHVIMGVRTLSKGTKALEELQARDPAGKLSVIQLDVTDDTSINAAVERITADHGVLDVLVNNAGIVVMAPTDRRTEFLDTLNTNAVGPLVLTERLLPLLQKSENPRIINVTSRLGSITERSDSNSQYYPVPAEAYRVSKAALNMTTACMYAMYKSWGAKVWAFCPGYVVSNLTGEAGRQERIAMGLEGSDTSAQGILEIVQGQRDAEVGLFLQRRGLRADW